MTRQGGADAVDLDTVEQIATVYYMKPRKLDFAMLVEAATSAAYTTIEVQVVLDGELLEAGDAARGELRVRETGQKFPFVGQELPPKYIGRLKAEVRGYDSDKPELGPRASELPASWN